MGKSSAPSVPTVQPKSLSQLYTDTVNSQIQNLPQLFQAFQQYGPQYAQVMAQQFNQLVPNISSAYYGSNPTLQPTQQFVGQRIQDAMSGDIPSGLLTPFRESLREAQAARGMADSPLSAASESYELAQAGEAYRENVINEGTNLLTANPINPAIGSILPKPLSPADLNLNGAPAGQLTAIGSEQDEATVSNSYDQFALHQAEYNRKLKQRQAGAQIIGGVIGGVAGGVAGGPAGAYQGAQLGAGVGQGVGTFF